MAETFSLATLGRNANSPYTVQPLTVGDAGAGRPGDQQLAMATGARVLCKRPDGSTAWFTIDAERSRPGALVMIAVGP